MKIEEFKELIKVRAEINDWVFEVGNVRIIVNPFEYQIISTNKTTLKELKEISEIMESSQLPDLGIGKEKLIRIAISYMCGECQEGDELYNALLVLGKKYL